jgi:VWFA-related protein
VAALLVATAGAHGSAQQPTFSSRVNLITVDAVVFDRQGNPVEGLTQSDFTIREDGAAQAITTFEAVTLQASAPAPQGRQRVSTNAARPDAAGRWFFVVFDDVNITQFATVRAREALVQFIERALRTGDHVMIAPSSGGSNWIGELPQDREDLVAFVQRLQGERRVDTSSGRIWDSEALGITTGRDAQAQAQVARRYFENGLIQEAELSNTQEIQENFGARAPGGGVAPGLQAIRIKARQTYTEATTRIRVSLGTLERMAAALAEARGRKTLLFFSEGFIMDPSLSEFRTLLQAARNANVAVHFVDVRAPGSSLGAAGAGGGGAEFGRAVQENDAGLAMALIAREADGTRSVAVDTGGSVVTGTNLMAGLARIANEGRSYYLLGYSPANTRRDGRFRKIEVTVNRANLIVRARGGYVAPAEREPPRPLPDTLDPAVRAALDAPFGAPGIPMRLTSYVVGPPVGGKLQTLLVAEADPAPLRLQPKGGRYVATFDSYVLVHDRDRDALERGEKLVELDLPADIFARVTQTGVPIQREFSLEPGRYQATVLLRDRATGLIGSVRHEFAVPAPNQFRISTPIVTDTILPAAAGQPGRPVPIARRTFKAGTRILAAFDIYGVTENAPGSPQVSVAYALRRADGTLVAASQPQTLKPNTRGQFSVTIGVMLPAGASGEHTLHVSVRDEPAVRVLEHVEPMTISQ